MPIVMDDGILVTESEKPGYVSVIGGPLKKLQEITFEQAEIFKENHIRSKFGLGKTDQIAPRQLRMTSICHRCRCRSNLRCSSCRMRYCSLSCQKKDWRRHIFICRIKNRSNDVDFLKIIIRRWFSANDELRQASTLTSLFSDDNLCKMFGFNNCADIKEVGSLLCLYRHMIIRLRTKGVQLGVDGVHGAFGNYMEAFATITTQLGEDNFSTCSCFDWFCTVGRLGFASIYQTGTAVMYIKYRVCAKLKKSSH